VLLTAIRDIDSYFALSDTQVPLLMQNSVCEINHVKSFVFHCGLNELQYKCSVIFKNNKRNEKNISKKIKKGHEAPILTYMKNTLRVYQATSTKDTILTPMF